MSWQWKTASAVMFTIAILVVPGSGAATPDYMDGDGDTNTGPTGIRGFSVASDGKEFQMTLHIDGFDADQPSIQYWWDFDATGRPMRWTCTVTGAYGSMALDCDMADLAENQLDLSRATGAASRVGGVAVGQVGIEAMGSDSVSAQYVLRLDDDTLRATVPYKELGVASGDTVDLLGGGARTMALASKSAASDLDLMVLGRSITLR